MPIVEVHVPPSAISSMTTLHSHDDPGLLRIRVDAQHHVLASLIDRICTAPAPGDDIDDMLSEAIRTLLEHMELEMAYLEQTSQPEALLKTRRVAHQTVIEDIANFSFAKMEDKQTNRPSICDQVRTWVRSHHGEVGASA